LIANDRLLAPEGTCRVKRRSDAAAPDRPLTGTPFCICPVGGSGSGPPPPPSNSEYSNRLGEALPAPVTLLAVELLISAVATWLGVALGLPARYSAATPATCGDAIEVPLMVLVDELLLCQAAVIDEHGAKMSRPEP